MIFDSLFLLQPALLKAIFNVDPDEVRSLIFKKEDVNAQVIPTDNLYSCFLILLLYIKTRPTSTEFKPLLYNFPCKPFITISFNSCCVQKAHSVFLQYARSGYFIALLNITVWLGLLVSKQGWFVLVFLRKTLLLGF